MRQWQEIQAVSWPIELIQVQIVLPAGSNPMNLRFMGFFFSGKGSDPGGDVAFECLLALREVLPLSYSLQPTKDGCHFSFSPCVFYDNNSLIASCRPGRGG